MSEMEFVGGTTSILKILCTTLVFNVRDIFMLKFSPDSKWLSVKVVFFGGDNAVQFMNEEISGKVDGYVF